jgi:hypothetical protein
MTLGRGGEPQSLAAGYDRSEGLNLQSGFVIVPPPTPQKRQVKCCAPVGGMVAFLPVFYPPPDHPCLRTQEGEDHRQNRLDHVTSDVPPVLKFPPVATSSFRGQLTPLPVPRRAIASIRGVTSRLDWFENVQGVGFARTAANPTDRQCDSAAALRGTAHLFLGDGGNSARGSGGY